jgi:yecA family protein
MNTVSTLTHAQLGEMLARLQLGVGASDLHGSLTGYVCGGGSAGANGWLDALELKPERYADFSDALTQLYADCVAWFDDPQEQFEPLLPGTDAAIKTRADALVEWCRGFLGGIGLADIRSRQELSADANEILGDLSTIAASHFEYADAEEDETALVEVIEFIRVGVLLLHAELHARPGATTVH